MTSKDALVKIKEILGFTAQSFSIHTIAEGGEIKVEGELESGKEVYIVTAEGELPAPDGKFQLEDGIEIVIKEGKVSEIIAPETEEEVVAEEEAMEEEVKEEEAMEEEVKEEETEMAEVSLIDGTIVGNDETELAVGQELYIISEEGRTIAPDGEHETEDGKIIVIVEGKITEIKEKEEVAEDVTEELMEAFTSALELLKNEIESLKESNELLNEKFSKFSNEPAGEKVYNNIKHEMAAHKTDRLSALSQLRRKK